MIRFDNVSKRYQDGTIAVHSLDLEIKEGEFFVIIGPSGCGKTTTLKMINRLIALTDGTLYIHDKKISEFDIYELRWNIGYVLQQIALFPHMTIEENISIVPELRKWSRNKIQQRVCELLEMVGLDPHTYRNRKPIELSGGEQQRIGVIRALAADPKIILMDEPFSALDPISRENLQDELLNLQRKIKKTIVFVTHDMQEALKLGDRICLMKDGEIVQIGTPQDILLHPANEFVSEFVGNRQPGLDENFAIEKILDKNSSIVTKTNTISIKASFKEALEKLAEQDELAVEQEGAIIGKINRQAVIQYLANRSSERGAVNE